MKYRDMATGSYTTTKSNMKNVYIENEIDRSSYNNRNAYTGKATGLHKVVFGIAFLIIARFVYVALTI